MIHRIHGIEKTEGMREIKDFCRICDGWVDYCFSWTPNLSGPVKESPIYIHLSFDGYFPHLLTKNEN